jgi:RHS repeat-associated protein
VYDDFNRLITSTCTANCPQNPSGLAFNYVYDRYGNRWQQNVTAGKGTGPQYIFSSGNNQITGSGVVYDAAGNVMNDGLGNTFTYDGENRISSVNDHASIYVYDAEGLRVRKTTGGASVDYIFDLSGHQVAEVSSSGGWNRGEVYAGGRHLATYSGGTSGTIYFPYTDWLGTERARATETGTVCESITSLPYGDMQNITGSCGDPSPMHFTGKQRDTETGLDDFGARYYSSVQGRWYSPDWASAQVPVPYADLHNPQTLNLYDYVGGDPTNHADADGHLSAKPGDSGDAAENGGCPSTYSYASCAGAAKPQTPAQNQISRLRPRGKRDIRASLTPGICSICRWG